MQRPNNKIPTYFSLFYFSTKKINEYIIGANYTKMKMIRDGQARIGVEGKIFISLRPIFS